MSVLAMVDQFAQRHSPVGSDGVKAIIEPGLSKRGDFQIVRLSFSFSEEERRILKRRSNEIFFVAFPVDELHPAKSRTTYIRDLLKTPALEFYPFPSTAHVQQSLEKAVHELKHSLVGAGTDSSWADG